MSEMVRKQIYISKRQEQILKRLSRSRGISEAALIRQAIDREVVNASSPLPPGNDDAWQEAVAFMRSLRSRSAQFSQPYQWDRAELYNERLNRYAVKETQENHPNASTGGEDAE